MHIYLSYHYCKQVCFVNTEQLNEYVDVSTLPKEVMKEYDQQFKDAHAALKASTAEADASK